MKKAIIEVKHPRGNKSIKVEVADDITLDQLQLDWLNEYINREAEVCVCQTLKHAKKISKLNIKARWI